MLLLGFESLLASETVAVFASTVGVFDVPAVAFTSTVTLMTAPLADEIDNGVTVPTLQLTVPLAAPQGMGTVVHLPLAIEQLTLVPDTLTKDVLGSRTSFTATLTAFADPKFPTPMR